MTFILSKSVYRARPFPIRPRLWIFCGGFIIIVAFLHAIYTWSHGYRGWTAVGGRIIRTYSQWRGLTPSSFAFQPERPAWLSPPSPPPAQPITMQIAVLSAANEFEIRDFLRKAVYNASRIPSAELTFDYKFFVGRHGDQSIDDAVQLESEIYHDLVVVDATESTWALSVKRFEALQWAAEAPVEDYDFLFTVDSDSFVRLTALARRMNHLRSDLVRSAAAAPSLWGQFMNSHDHWRESTNQAQLHDEKYFGEWYTFPVGLGYLMSSALVARLHAVADLLPHHVAYYADDVVVGSWIAEHVPETWYINDIGGFHDPPMHGMKVSLPIDYGTVVIHHADLNEMRALRDRQEWADEWLSPRETRQGVN